MYSFLIVTMKINILIFGQLCELLGSNLVVNNITDTNSLTALLNKKYPELINSKYAMAVDKKLVTENIILTDDSTVALLPPFSGG